MIHPCLCIIHKHIHGFEWLYVNDAQNEDIINQSIAIYWSHSAGNPAGNTASEIAMEVPVVPFMERSVGFSSQGDLSNTPGEDQLFVKNCKSDSHVDRPCIPAIPSKSGCNFPTATARQEDANWMAMGPVHHASNPPL